MGTQRSGTVYRCVHCHRDVGPGYFGPPDKEYYL